MGIAETVQAYNEALISTDGERAMQVVERAVATGLRPEEVVFDVVLPSMESLMSRDCSEGGTSLAMHFSASQISSEVVERMLPLFKQASPSAGTIVIGSSVGDFHGLGKRIVCGCLRARMFEVTDLGLNVPAERLVDEAVRLNASVIGVSSMMVHTATGPRAAHGVRALIKERKLEKRLKLVVGGAPYIFDEHLYSTVGADAWARNALDATRVIAQLVEQTRS